jgi:hypothetical protein
MRISGKRQEHDGDAALVDGHFLVQGPHDFLLSVHQALTLIASRAPIPYTTVRGNVARIQLGQNTHAIPDATPPLIRIGELAVAKSLTWVAHAIAHEAYHCYIYRSYFERHPTAAGVPWSEMCGPEAEKECFRFQSTVAILIGAPEHEIEWILAQDGTHNA